MKWISVKTTYCSLMLLLSCACTNNVKEPSNNNISNENEELAILEEAEPHHLNVTERTIFYEDIFDKSNAFIVISKKYTDLSVYAQVEGDTILIVRYPVCLSRALGQKEKKGDMKTPECSMENPFTMSAIQNSSDWHHDFGDGRGSIKAYGNWFLRLSTPPHSGIGIHGSTNNESTIPGRDSEGCIRMRDADIIHLKENYAFKGMKVIIKHEDQDCLSFEKM